jgi:hypothetical protein
MRIQSHCLRQVVIGILVSISHDAGKPGNLAAVGIRFLAVWELCKKPERFVGALAKKIICRNNIDRRPIEMVVVDPLFGLLNNRTIRLADRCAILIA